MNSCSSAGVWRENSANWYSMKSMRPYSAMITDTTGAAGCGPNAITSNAGRSRNRSRLRLATAGPTTLSSTRTRSP